MPNEVLTEAIDAVASGTDLSAEQAQEVLGEIMAARWRRPRRPPS